MNGHGGNSAPRVVVLCGSTRFFDEFQRAFYRETMAGRIVLSVGFDPDSRVHHEGAGCTPEQKEELDRLHLAKIDMAHEVLVLDVGATSVVRRPEKSGMRRRTESGSGCCH
jgi:hypothetical protein